MLCSFSATDSSSCPTQTPSGKLPCGEAVRGRAASRGAGPGGARVASISRRSPFKPGARPALDQGARAGPAFGGRSSGRRLAQALSSLSPRLLLPAAARSCPSRRLAGRFVCARFLACSARKSQPPRGWSPHGRRGPRAAVRCLPLSAEDAFDGLLRLAPESVGALRAAIIDFVNRKLDRLGLSVQDLETQFADGVILLLLIGQLEGFFLHLKEFHLVPSSAAERVSAQRGAAFSLRCGEACGHALSGAVALPEMPSSPIPGAYHGRVGPPGAQSAQPRPPREAEASRVAAPELACRPLAGDSGQGFRPAGSELSRDGDGGPRWSHLRVGVGGRAGRGGVRGSRREETDPEQRARRF
ncbi:PREDICTED: gamma-parvin [Condylura cristata]|uniref:gamma-parvin n=1 Tax=Condylura cristata TaxID=143302 RepID=UPI00064312C8|nr:PREDICTED: gamma-parvin [Condylura cristata]